MDGMTASSLVEQLRARGIAVYTDGRRIGTAPAGALTDEDRAVIRRLKPDLIVLLSGPAERAAVFQDQLDQWQSEGRPGAPFFALPGVSAPPGCLSCGTPLPPDRAYRCSVCSDAIAVVLSGEASVVSLSCSRCGTSAPRAALTDLEGALWCPSCLRGRVMTQIATPRRIDQT
jgi:hypothetical protein